MAHQFDMFNASLEFDRLSECAWSLSVALALVALPAEVHAQLSARASAQCYTDTSGHAAARTCLENEAQITERRMIQSEGMLLAALEQSHEVVEERQHMVAALNEASAAYPRDRDAQCELQATLAAGGNAASDRRLLCKIELDDRRIADLVGATATAPR